MKKSTILAGLCSLNGLATELTVLSLKTAPGAFEIDKVTSLFNPLKSAPSHFMFGKFLLFSFVSNTVYVGFIYSKQKKKTLKIKRGMGICI